MGVLFCQSIAFFLCNMYAFRSAAADRTCSTESGGEMLLLLDLSLPEAKSPVWPEAGRMNCIADVSQKREKLREKK